MKRVSQPFIALQGEQVLCIGKFDGVHTGHAHLLRQARALADGAGAALCVYAMRPPVAAPYLTSVSERAQRMRMLGVDTLVDFAMTDAFISLSAIAFLERLMAAMPLRAIVVGEGFHFGTGARGDAALLRETGGRLGFSVLLVRKLQRDGAVVSSTAIRGLVQQGDLTAANAWLGYPYTLGGVIQPGRRLGTQLGFPTANLNPPRKKVIPADGVYITTTHLDGRAHPSLTNVGCNPTVRGVRRKIETHIPGLTGPLYGKRICLAFHKKIRDQLTFAGLQELRAQLARDVQTLAQEYPPADSGNAEGMHTDMV